jgi:prepilin-type N-terminal cleavage/methylation domain-containing protein/prepilin-type processing-associated H-X9-DG protein
VISCSHLAPAKKHHAFTLVEILVVTAILAILASLIGVSLPALERDSARAKSLSNLRQLGVAVLSYASENNQRLPGRIQTSDRWPRLLLPFLAEDHRIYADPGDPAAFPITGADPLSNARNNTSYILNGFNDVGAFDDETVSVGLPNLSQPANTILMSLQSGTGNFYMDFAEGNQNSILNQATYGSGSNYLFADGSARFLGVGDYRHELWLIDKSAPIPDPR